MSCWTRCYHRIRSSTEALTDRRKTQGYNENIWGPLKQRISKHIISVNVNFLIWQDKHKHMLTGKLGNSLLHGALTDWVHNHALFATICATLQLLYVIMFECLNCTFTHHVVHSNITVEWKMLCTRHVRDARLHHLRWLTCKIQSCETSVSCDAK